MASHCLAKLNLNDIGLEDMRAAEYGGGAALQRQHAVNFHFVTKGLYPINPKDWVMRGCRSLAQVKQVYFLNGEILADPLRKAMK